MSGTIDCFSGIGSPRAYAGFDAFLAQGEVRAPR